MLWPSNTRIASWRLGNMTPITLTHFTGRPVRGCLAVSETNDKISDMSVQELESAVSKLSREELAAFRRWFVEFDAAAWDKQFEEDVAAGRLDKFADEALSDLKQGRATPS